MVEGLHPSCVLVPSGKARSPVRSVLSLRAGVVSDWSLNHHASQKSKKNEVCSRYSSYIPNYAAAYTELGWHVL